MIRRVLVLQEFNFVVRDRKGTENQVDDHLCRMEYVAFLKLGDKFETNNVFRDEHAFATSDDLILWFEDFAN